MTSVFHSPGRPPGRPLSASGTEIVREGSHALVHPQNAGRHRGRRALPRWLRVGGSRRGCSRSSRAPNGTPVCGRAHNNVGGASVTDYNPHHNPFEYYASTANPNHLPPANLAEVGNDGQANHEYDL